ncbi:MAG: hypothetical protein IJH32_08300 [Ruminococcus sp.]|nr:hypothetical protein [Ruminococcus sp.]
MKVVKQILNTIINILIILVLVISILIAVMALTSKATGISNVFGFTFQPIQTDSMKGGSDEYEGGDFAKGDLIVGKATGFDSARVYQVGDIITYRGVLSGAEDLGEQLISHRIIGTYDLNGMIVYRTMGDNNDVADQAEDDYASYITASNIGAVFYSADYHGSIIHGLGAALSFIQTQLGFFLCVLLPMIIFFLYEIIRVVINAVNYRNDKAKEEIKQTEEEQQAAIDAAVAAALKKQQDADAPAQPQEDASADFPQMTEQEYEEFKQFQAFKKMQEDQNE